MNLSLKELINEKSADAGLTIIGFRGDHIKNSGTAVFSGYDNLGTVLFVNAHDQLEIE